jgi:signal transduction histidine kinase
MPFHTNICNVCRSELPAHRFEKPFFWQPAKTVDLNSREIMSTQTKLLLSMVMMILLPLSVTVITWFGLVQMDQAIQHVAEEFTEAQSLQPIERNLEMAILVLDQDSPTLEVVGIEYLKKAEASLVEFLAEQYGHIASKKHQEEEAQLAVGALSKLTDLLGPNWEDHTQTERLSQINLIQQDVHSLYSEAALGVLESPVAAQRSQRRTLAMVLVFGIASALSCVFIAMWSAQSVLRRLRDLHSNVLSRTNTQPPNEPKDVSGVLDQLEELSERMVLKIEEKNRELLRRERMAGIGLLAADVAHEINNPMNAMLGLSELSLQTTAHGPIDEPGRVELHESMTVIHREILRCRGIIERLMAMVRGEGEPQWINVTQLLAETLEVARAARPDKAACFHAIGTDRHLQVYAPQSAIRQIILTLLINAADAITQDGRIEVDSTHSDDEVWLRVRDNGRGFTPEMQEDFFVPFQTTRQKEGGVGLGLSIAQTLCTSVGAELRSFSDGPGTGSLFLLAIPIPRDTP